MAKKQLAMKVDHVSMRFNLSSEKVDNIKEYVIKMIKKELMFPGVLGVERYIF